MRWPDTRLLALLGTEAPIIQAPMAGAMDSALVVEACEGGVLGSLPCAMLTPEGVRAEVNVIRKGTTRPFALNFFCHEPKEAPPAEIAAWKARLVPYYRELGLDENASANAPVRLPFAEEMAEVVEETRPHAVSFHFGLPAAHLLDRVKKTGALVMGSATTRAEAKWLEERGADVIVAQGAEAGGHRGMFLTDSVASQPGTIALVPELVDAVEVPVVAAGGIADGRGIVAALALGAAGVQIGTAYLKCPESKIHAAFRKMLAGASADSTVITNAMTGRPARGFPNRIIAEQGPLTADAPVFPHAAGAIAPLRSAAEKAGSGAFSPFWSGQGASLATERGARELSRALAREALARIGELAGA